MLWQTTRFSHRPRRVPRVMGIVNVTPDSFSDGGPSRDPPRRSRMLRALVADGADILDIGGESTRPGAAPVPLAEELARVLPVIDAALRLGVPVSVDTRKPAGDARGARRRRGHRQRRPRAAAPGALEPSRPHRRAASA